MAALTTTKPNVSGPLLGYVAAAELGDTAKNHSSRLCLVVLNGSASPITVTIPSQVTTRPGDGAFPEQSVGNIAVAVAAGATRIIGPIPSAYNNATNDVLITYSAHADVLVAALELP